MRATGRMTWLLLSLSFLFHSACSDNSSIGTTGASTTSTANPKTTVGVSVTGTPTTTGSGKTTISTQASTTKPITAVTTPTKATITATSKPTDKPTSTQPQLSTVTNNPPAHSTTISGAPSSVSNGATTAATTTLSQTKTTPPAEIAGKNTTTDSSGSTAESSNTPALQTTGTPETSGTEAPDTQTSNVGTTKIVTSTPRPQFTTHTAITTSQDSNGGATKTTVAVTSNGQTTTGATEQAVTTGTTSTHPSLTTARPVTAMITNTGTTSPQTTPTTTTTPTPTTTTTTTPTTTTTTTTATANEANAQPKTFLYSLNNGLEKDEEEELAKVCRRLLENVEDGNCTLKWGNHSGKIQFDSVEINGKVKTSLATQYYEEISKKPTDNRTLIAILASCGALLIMIVILTVCASHRRKPYNENQQHLTEELHTVENGYHDNPTLEVMEVQPEMQEKKMALNDELSDSYIVPFDYSWKEDIVDEEDTHL